jgi:hypothetical protein
VSCRAGGALALLVAVLVIGACGQASAAVALPPWMEAQVDGASAVHDPEAGAISLLEQRVLTVHRNGSVTRLNRAVYLILRPSGSDRGTLSVAYNGGNRITRMHGWCRPASGQPYDVGEKQAVDSAPSPVLAASDLRERTLSITDPSPGSLIGFEWTLEEREPVVDDDDWPFQSTLPVRTTQYILELPLGWEHWVSWRNHAEAPAINVGPGRWQWTLSDVGAVPIEPAMPPVRALAGRLHVSFSGPGARGRSFQSWSDVGAWYSELSRGRDEPAADIRTVAAAVTAGATGTLARVQAIAGFVQTQVRYVAIAFGIGGYQPHPATDVLVKRYGDGKDHVALLIAMLNAAGIRAYPVMVNSLRGVVQDTATPELEFDHVIAAIALPPDTTSAALVSVQEDPALGRLLYFDATNPDIPLGRLSPDLQHSYGLLVAPGASRLVQLPQQPFEVSGARRHGKWTLSDSGMLTGELSEVLSGDYADAERGRLRRLGEESDRQKLIEASLSRSLSGYRILHAELGGGDDPRQQVEWRYSYQVERYAQSSGGLLLLRPRVQGIMSDWPLAAGAPRHNPVRLRRFRNTEDYEIALPPGYVVDDIPSPVDLEDGHSSYHSRTTVMDGVVHFTRTTEARELEVPATEAPRLRRFFDAILADERSMVTLRRASPKSSHTPP